MHRDAKSLRQQLESALAHHQRGRVDLAEPLYRAILAAAPRHFDALHLLGIATSDRGALDEGIELIRRALVVDPAQANAYYSLARALLAKGDVAAVLVSLGRALELRPDFADAWLLYGNAQQQLGRFGEAAASYERAIGVRPAFPEAFNNLAAALRMQRRLGPALERAERALALQPQYASALNNRGLILLDSGQGVAAVDSFRRALNANPRFAEALHNLGTALMRLGRYEEARDAYAQLLASAPGFRHAQGNLLHAKLCCCDWTDYVAATAAVADAVARGEHAEVPMALLCVSGSAALQRCCAERYTADHYPPDMASADTEVRRPAAVGGAERIRVAYLSGDFGAHAVTYLLSGVFERHDAARFETIALSWGRQDEGPARRRVEAAFSRFIDISAVGDADAARLLRDLGVDIAVDLTGHTQGHRTGILARRPAPVQVNYLGLPATMGAGYIDYLIADRYLIPDDQRVHYTEQVVWLPVSYQPNDDRRPLRPDRQPRRAHGLPDQGLVFCTFNNNFKLNPQWFDVCMRLLLRVPGSVLWLLAAHPAAANNLRREAGARGVDSRRLICAPNVPYEDYLARYVHADLFLDSLPFNGGTTASDALSMGVPVLTCVGESFAARMAGSLLSSLGLGELITHSLADYEAAALALAANPARLRGLGEQLLRLRNEHPFFDTDYYRKSLEAAYRAMWMRQAAGLPAAAFCITAEDVRG